MRSYVMQVDGSSIKVDESYTIPTIRHISEGMRGKNHVVCVVFNDGSHVIKECLPEDKYDLNVGVALCLADKLIGSTTQYHKLIKRKLTQKKTKGNTEENRTESEKK